MVVHGTTLATNAVIERRGAKVAFLTTEGFRDTLEMAYEHRYDQYDLLVDKPLPLVPRKLRLPVPERVLPPMAVCCAHLIFARRRDRVASSRGGVDAVAIGFLHAYANPMSTSAQRRDRASAFPTRGSASSSDVSPEIREYERFCTVTANAYVQP